MEAKGVNGKAATPLMQRLSKTHGQLAPGHQQLIDSILATKRALEFLQPTEEEFRTGMRWHQELPRKRNGTKTQRK